MILLVDNYDSFTYNLVQYFGELGVSLTVKRNDVFTVNEALALKPRAIVLSPGPCNPDKAGICLELVKRSAETKIPMLGVCLGHQSIAQAFGGKIIQCHEIVHGKISEIYHSNFTPLKNIPSPFQATRYHSLTVERNTLPADLETTAWTSDGVIMGLKHKSLPIFGLQFHPESISTKVGHNILSQFLKVVNEAN